MRKCENCVHYDVCYIDEITNDKSELEDCELYIDKSLCVVLPCSIGETYYRIVHKRGKVGNDYFYLIREAKLNWYNIGSVIDDLGKTVFLDRTEAEKKLKELQGE